MIKKIVLVSVLFLIPFFNLQAEDATSTPQYVHDASQVEGAVRSTFVDAPVMIDIARCESKFRQFTDAGNIFRGGDDDEMVGIFQIYNSIHYAKARSLGYDIETVDGNIGYAKYLYSQNGTSPWLSSFSCWNTGTNENSVATSAATSTESSTLTQNLSLGTISPEVLTLQKILNASEFKIAENGPGSRGNETNKFGSLTRDAVRRFQCAKNIICSGDEYTTGYGYVGARTRAEILKLSSSPLIVGDDSTEIARLEAHIVELQKVISTLLEQIRNKQQIVYN